MVRSSSSDGSLRADAERNRERILDAAREVLAEQGLDAPMYDIAKRAGVGVGTLYRRFPTRGDLIAGAFLDQMATFATSTEVALADPDPWHGFCGYVERLCAAQSANRGLRDVLTMTFPSTEKFETTRRRVHAGVTELITRAQAAGALRADFVAEDLIMLLMANAGVIASTGQTAPRTSPRLIAYLLQAFAAPGGELPPPPSERQIYRALVRQERDTETRSGEQRTASKEENP